MELYITHRIYTEVDVIVVLLVLHLSYWHTLKVC